jgi:hypothetical protein
MQEIERYRRASTSANQVEAIDLNRHGGSVNRRYQRIVLGLRRSQSAGLQT